MIDAIRETLLGLPAFARWPDARAVIARVGRIQPGGVLDYPVRGAQAVGGRAEDAAHAAAAVFLGLSSIHLVDDLLDDDPDGLYHELGTGRTANLALALQAASQQVVRDLDLPPGHALAMADSLAEMAVSTAYGQELDVHPFADEATYWRAVHAKTPPLFSCGLFLGAVAAGAPLATARALAELGTPLGILVQVGDDLSDAMQTPAKPDWRRPRNNLPILYACVADHPQRDRFLALLDQIDDGDALREAQDILIRSGGMSYCYYRMVEAYNDAWNKLETLDLAAPKPIEELIELHVTPLRELMEGIGIDMPPLREARPA